jgi:WD40 repeat protein
VAFSADGKRLIAGASETTVHVWAWPPVKPPRTFLGPDDYFDTCAAVSPDGKTLAVGAEGAEGAAVLMCDLDSGAIRRTITAASGSVMQIAFAENGKRVATLGWSQAKVGIYLLQVWDNRPRPAWSVTFDEGSDCMVCPGDRLFAGGYGTIRQWQIATGKPLPTLETGCDVRALAVTPDGGTLFSEGTDHVLLAWDVDAGRVVQTMHGHSTPVVVLACTADGRRLVSVGLDGDVRLWDVATGEQLASLYDARETASAAAFAPDGRTLVVAATDHSLDRWDLDTLETTPLIRGHTTEVVGVAFAASGRELHTWSAAEALRWDTETGRLLGTASGERPQRPKIVTSPGGKYRITVDPDKSVFPSLAVVATGKEVELAGALRSVRAAAFSRDDKILVAAGSDGNITLWETDSGQVLADFKARQFGVNCVAFAPDGRTFATGGEDTTVLIWSLTACGAALTERWRKPDADDLENMWKALFAENGEDAFAAMRGLTAAPKKAVPLLRSKLPPPVNLARIKGFVAQLDADDFETREKASQELERLGRDAEQALRDARAGKPSAEMRRRIDDLLSNLQGDDAPRVRCWLRAIFVLEQIGTPEAREILKLLAEGDRVAKAAEDARAALKRK